MDVVKAERLAKRRKERIQRRKAEDAEARKEEAARLGMKSVTIDNVCPTFCHGLQLSRTERKREEWRKKLQLLLESTVPLGMAEVCTYISWFKQQFIKREFVPLKKFYCFKKKSPSILYFDKVVTYDNHIHIDNVCPTFCHGLQLSRTETKREEWRKKLQLLLESTVPLGMAEVCTYISWFKRQFI